MPDPTIPELCGWHSNPEEVDFVMSTMPFPMLMEDAAPHLIGTWNGEDVKLWDACIKVTGNNLPADKQTIGDCFPNDTLVTMGDSSKKPIIQVQVGEEVLDRYNVKRKVKTIISKPYSGPLLTVSTDHSSVTATPDHRFLEYSPNLKETKWKSLIDFRPRQIINHNKINGNSPIKNISEINIKNTQVYCLEIENEPSFIANDFIVHNCVSHGFSRGVDYLTCLQISLNVTPGMEFIPTKHDCYSEAIYGMMRERAGQLSNQDGAVGAWALNSLIKDGAPIRDGHAYNGQNAKKWGAQGTPADIKSSARNRLLKQGVKAKTIDQAADFLANGYPIPICSNQGFTMKRNANGICEASGTWSHCMLCIGLLMVNGERIFVILQSWGQNTPSGPTIKNMPDNSFGCRDSIFKKILNAGDSYAISGIPGFPRQDLVDMFV